MPYGTNHDSLIEEAENSGGALYSREFPPFDNTLVVYDDAGQPIRYLIDPLAEHYIVPPGFSVTDGMLPPEEFAVRKALVEMKLFTERYMSFGVFKRFFHRDEYVAAGKLASRKQEALAHLVNSGPLYKAALRRIVNAMPEDNGGREALREYTK